MASSFLVFFFFPLKKCVQNPKNILEIYILNISHTEKKIVRIVVHFTKLDISGR